ncbi:MAG: hypothetical protein ACRD1B_06130, partial [Thermoanaerobaculia bacterium]
MVVGRASFHHAGSWAPRIAVVAAITTALTLGCARPHPAVDLDALQARVDSLRIIGQFEAARAPAEELARRLSRDPGATPPQRGDARRMSEVIHLMASRSFEDRARYVEAESLTAVIRQAYG